MPSLAHKISALEFARRLKFAKEGTDRRYALFLGAGCSISSGIPGTAGLVRNQWLPRLHRLRALEGQDLDTWARTVWPDYDPQNASALYGTLIGELFLTAEERQNEIERLCDGKFPGYGYAVLAAMMAEQKGCFNVALTTNFDDLIADALYLFTRSRPLVIQHESLAPFVRPMRTRPLIVKLHGDHRLTPQKTTQETAQLKAEIETQIRSLLQDRGLIFMGYSGNDKVIAEMLSSLPSNAVPYGVYWVHDTLPGGKMQEWLCSHDAVWVDKLDFDEFMLLVGAELGHSCLEENRLRGEELFDKHRETYRKVARAVRTLPDTAPEANALKLAVERTAQTFNDWYRVELEAQRLEKSDPDRADAVYRDGLKQFPQSHKLMGNYAVFLKNVRKNYDEAEIYFRRALRANSDDADHLANYAFFLKNVRKNYNEAEVYYRRALEADPDNADHPGNYALFLSEVRKNYDEADVYYRRAVETDPDNARQLGNYAIFLSDIRKNYDEADAYYRRAVEADPNNANRLGNYAGFLLGQGHRQSGLEMLQRAFDQINTVSLPGLLAECWFYAFADDAPEMREEALRHLKTVLMEGDRSPGWNFEANIAQAEKEGHPDVEWLHKLAQVIAQGADIHILDDWPEWQKL